MRDFGARVRPAGNAHDNHAMGKPVGFKGNKQSLPSKPCLACGRDMVWRRAWARNWAELKVCSDACRRRGTAARNGR